MDKNVLKDIQKALYPQNSCVKCKGEFQWKEKVMLDIYNKSYCEACYKETYES